MCDDGRPGIRRVEFVMGMPVVVDVRDEHASDGDLDELFGWLRRVDETFSTYKTGSQLSRLNRGELTLAAADADVQTVLARCEELREETNGFFDARFDGGALDPSGLVKGWSVDRGAAILDARGFVNYAVNAGGDIRLRGGAVPDLVWRVGIQHPLVREGVAAVVEGDDLAVATSGEYARGQHVLDPHTRDPPRGVLSVTITGPDLATADAYATAAFAMGADRAPHWTARLRGYEAMTILADGRVLSTPGFPRAGAEASTSVV
jgi:thiamine biosynthesis lipoprotein